MFTVRAEQINAMESQSRHNFHLRLCDYVREKLPEESASYDDAQLLETIAVQDRIAVQHGIFTEQGIAQWVCLSFRPGRKFYEEPGFKDYFEAPGPPDPETRLLIYVDCLCALKQDPNAQPEKIIAKRGYRVVW